MKYQIEGDTLEDIADAIRYKAGSIALINPEDMADAIYDISGSGNVIGKYAVKYPVGSTVTATHDNLELVSDTSGQYTFEIPATGTWTFTCGDKSKTHDFLIPNASFAYATLIAGAHAKATGGGGSKTISVPTTGVAAGSYQLLVVCINGEGSSFALNAAVAVNGAASTVTSLFYQDYNGGRDGGNNTRNMRVSVCDVTLTGNDTIDVTITNASRYTEVICILTESNGVAGVSAVRSTNDATINNYKFPSGTTGNTVLYGDINGSSGRANYYMVPYDENESYSSTSVQSNYGAGFIILLS